jgi:hypothetical protein
VFDFKEAFQALNGKTFTQKEFRLALEQILAENLRFLPAEYRTRDLAVYAQAKGWLKSECPGLVRVVVE